MNFDIKRYSCMRTTQAATASELSKAYPVDQATPWSLSKYCNVCTLNFA